MEISQQKCLHQLTMFIHVLLVPLAEKLNLKLEQI